MSADDRPRLTKTEECDRTGNGLLYHLPSRAVSPAGTDTVDASAPSAKAGYPIACT